VVEKLRVGIIGAGAIGGEVARALNAEQIPGATLQGTFTRHSDRTSAFQSIDELLPVCDVIVEAAGHEALAEYGPQVLDAGVNLVVVSIGALADSEFRDKLRTSGPGRMVLCSGAIGGLDVLQAAALSDGLTHVELTTRKRPSSLPPAVASAFGSGTDEPQVVFSGSAREAALKFPENLNVAAALALATVGFERTRVTLVADPRVGRTQHRIEASGPLGSYRFEFDNEPLLDRPSTSAVVPAAVLRSLALLAGSAVRFG
jgi:aspartate dehydrogenase